MRIIDCTFRDGGYQNDWYFSKKLVNKYLRAMSQANITDVEIGFRSNIDSNTSGPLAYTKNSFLSQLSIPSNINLGVMINAKEFKKSNGDLDLESIKILFDTDLRIVNFVRIALTSSEIKPSIALKNFLTDLGYEVHFNIMRVSTLIEDSKFFYELNNLPINENIKNITFADTFGSLNQEQLTKIIERVDLTKMNLGIHLHDNLGLATSNSLHAINLGIKSIDSTITGMGRGPGNARTEFMLQMLDPETKQVQNYIEKPVIEIACSDFEPLKKSVGWGPSTFYMLAATKQIHPTYVQNLISDGRYSASQVLNAIEELGRDNSLEINKKLPNTKAVEKVLQVASSPRLIERWGDGKNAFILGPGLSLRENLEEVESILTSIPNKLTVSLNLAPLIDPKLVDVFTIFDPMKLAMDKMIKVDQKIITPYSKLDFSFLPDNSEQFEFTIQKSQFKINNHIAVLPHLSTLGYCLLSLVKGCVSKIYLLGFDGDFKNSQLQNDNQEIIDMFHKNFNHIDIFISTKSSYRANFKSIFSF
jgi:4-hydroxy 2-oxovalerate aldolase